MAQFTYAAGKNKTIELRPVSARMGLPAQPWSFLPQEFARMLAVDQAYEQALSHLSQILGGQFSVDTAGQVNRHTGATAGAFLADLPTPEPGSEAKPLVASTDGKGVPLVKKDAAKVTAFEVSQKNPGKPSPQGRFVETNLIVTSTSWPSATGIGSANSIRPRDSFVANL